MPGLRRRGRFCAEVALLGWLAVGLAGAPACSAEEAAQSVALTCSGRLAAPDPVAAAAPDITFKTSIPFGQGSFVTLTSPETKSIERMLYGSEVEIGAIEIGGAGQESVVWTKATSLKGSVVGFFIESGGDLVSLGIRAAPKGETDRPFDLFATASRALYRGSCH